MPDLGGRVFNGCTEIQTPLTRRKLVEMKRRAIRRGIWFTALGRVERACIDLTITVVDKVRSLLLAKVLTAVVEKLSDAMENKITRLARRIGQPLAQKISFIAQSWGHPSAIQWKSERSFTRFLAITYINTPAVFRG